MWPYFNFTRYNYSNFFKSLKGTQSLILLESNYLPGHKHLKEKDQNL